MRAFRPWFTASFFWLPLVITLLLNPGRNASNIQQFSSTALLALAICGGSMVFYSTVGFTQPRAFNFALADKSSSPAGIAFLLLSLVLGLIGIYSAWQGL